MDHSGECALAANLNGWRDVHVGTDVLLLSLVYFIGASQCPAFLYCILVLPLEEVEAKEGIMAKGGQVIYD